MPSHYLQGYEWYPSKWFNQSHLFTQAPDTIVVHSGSSSPNVAEYLHFCPDGRKVSCHICWSGKKRRFVQQVSLLREAWHVGGSLIEGRRGNSCSIGIELSGPYNQNPRDEYELELFSKLLIDLTAAVPSLSKWVKHSDINPSKKDPGKGFLDELMSGFVWVG